MNIDDSADGFQFDDDLVFDNHVQAMFSDDHILIRNMDFNLGFSGQMMQLEFVKESVSVNGFQETRAQRSMNFHGSADNRVRQFLAFHAHSIGTPSSVLN